MRYFIAPSLQAMRGLGVGFLYLTQLGTAINIFKLILEHSELLKSDSCNPGIERSSRLNKVQGDEKYG
jgi:hypothetical protein